MKNEKKIKNGKLHGGPWVSIKRYFLTGIAALFPLFITAYVIALLFRAANRFDGNYINHFLALRYGFTVPGAGLALLVCVIFLTGFISSNYIGRKVGPLMEKVFLRIPLVAYIYPPARQLSDFLFGGDKKMMVQKVVMVEYPAPGSYSIGFMTNDAAPKIKEMGGSKELISVLVPLAPAPFSGLLIFMPRDKVVFLDMSVEAAIKIIVSGGVVTA